MRAQIFTSNRVLLRSNTLGIKFPSFFIKNSRIRFNSTINEIQRIKFNDQSEKGKRSLFRRSIFNLCIGILIPYTGYAFYVVAGASKEINCRNEKLIEIEEGSELKDEGTLVKYSPLKILNRYENPFEEYRIQTVYEFFFNRVVEIFERNRGGIPDNKAEMSELMPVYKPDWLLPGKLPRFEEQQPENALCDLTVISANDNPIMHEEVGKTPEVYNTWLGQSCNYIYYNGVKILTDPLFSDFLIHEEYGPKRITEQPCDIDLIPRPDIIMVSHNHPDHLDNNSMLKWGSTDVLWVVPKGIANYLKKNGVQNIIELCWWESLEFKKNDEIYHLSAVPAMHWSGRGLLDINESLWCSFLLTHKRQPILFHAGDTGYVNDLYQRIKLRYGSNCKLALLPCGQYCPEWHQRPRHINPQEVLKIMQDLEAQNVLGIHWGTFVLSGEYFREPKEKLELLAEWDGKADKCFCPELGKTIKFD